MSTNSAIAKHIFSLEWNIERCKTRMEQLKGELDAYECALWSAQYLLSEEEKVMHAAKVNKKRKVKQIGLEVADAKKKQKHKDIVEGNHTF